MGNFMSKKKKRIPVNSVGKIIKEAREKKSLSIEELTWKLNKPNITKKLVADWEKGQEFPDLDNIYLLAQTLDLDPNELLNKRLTIQDESIHEINPANRRVGGKAFHAVFVIVKQCVKWIGAICIIYLVISYKDFEDRMGNDPEQYELVEDIMVNAINEYTEFNAVNDEKGYELPPLKQYFRNQYSKDKNEVNKNNTVSNTVEK